MKNLILSAFLILTSCKLKVDKENGIIGSFLVGGNCHLVDGGQDALCVEYQIGTLSNAQIDADCDAKATFYSSINMSTHYSSYSPTIACRSSGKVGKCTLSTKVIYYYDNDWTDLTAEADCTSLSGTYTNL